MSEINYKDALKLGQKEAQSRKANGESPALPALDDLLPADKPTTVVNLGLVSIPIKQIVGTKTGGRSSAFAANFMPILEENSEFATKWKHLCEAHITEGIHDPIKAYEYKNRFYVLEGNKRVSVLKFFGADTIEGVVTRILPERDGSDEIELYYEFVAFYQYSKINFIEFSKRGSYTALQTVLGKELDEEWTIDEQRTFAAAYHKFDKAYTASGGEKLQSTIGDAMLSYLKIYGYEELIASDADEIKKNLGKMWEDVKLKDAEEPIELKTEPPEEKSQHQGLISRVLSQTISHALQVAFIYDGTPAKSGWVHEHEEGRIYVQKIFEDKIDTVTYPNALDGDPYDTIAQAIDDGCEVIFTTSPRLISASVKAAVEHPDVIIMNCSLNLSSRYIATYYARMYEAKFILGAVAGSLSDSGKLGYVCDYPIYGQIAGINAFAIGAQLTNPRAHVYLEWSSVKGAEGAAQALAEQDIHFISSQDTAKFLEDDRDTYGLSYVVDDHREVLVDSVWCWGKYYEEILNRIFDKTLQAEYNKTDKALNYYWGMSSGVVDVWCSETLIAPTRKLIDFLKESIRQNICIPFLTPLTTQSGEVIGEDQKSLTLEQIINMDYLVDNVIGEIPTYDELSPMGKATVDTAGIEKSQNDIVKEAEKKTSDEKTADEKAADEKPGDTAQDAEKDGDEQ
ncbi:BMP family ABC transporter substrate-binding protein [Ruminococcus sp.]|uniref:BMP family ABC transporter substrate-binding protein n=1 Tax=Ruminococcus sp. TaxID=41978 RepID=UPI002E7FE6C8|nr:BMP family ABC transporter substrate-binding protein [Ruminococcus sp.]MEE3492391.1 BMP family ABC transporter substrate-binding protein [Ruminococcus sp.]